MEEGGKRDQIYVFVTVLFIQKLKIVIIKFLFLYQVLMKPPRFSVHINPLDVTKRNIMCDLLFSPLPTVTNNLLVPTIYTDS